MTRFLTAISLIFLAAGSTALAQTSPDPVDLGLEPYHDYHGGDIDHVNIDNGNLTLTIPLVSYPQRGTALKMDLEMVYNGAPRTYSQFCIPGPPTQLCTYGWFPPSTITGAVPQGLGTPQLVDTQNIVEGLDKIPEAGTTPQAYFYQFSWATSDGGVHSAGQVMSGQTATGQISLDGSGFQTGFVSDSTNYNYPDTCVWGCALPQGVVTPTGTYPSLVATRDGITWITGQNGTARIDTDGNYIVSNGSGYTDTVGRQIPNPASVTPTNGCYSTYDWTPPGYSNPFVFCYVQITLAIGEITTNGGYLESHPTETVLQSITLPNNQAWTFEYGENLSNCPPSTGYTTNVGDLTQINFPTGGYIKYTYECIRPLGPSGYNQITAVTSRTVNANDGTGDHTWNYSYGSGTAGNTTMTDPTGNDTVDAVTKSSRVTTQYSGTGSGRTTLRTTALAYPSQYATPSGYPMYPTTQTSTLENSLATQTSYQYCCDLTYFQVVGAIGNQFPTAASYGKVTDTKVYDYAASGTGALLRETNTAYLFQSNTNYIDPGFFGLKSSETVYDGSGNQMLQATFGFDQTARVTSGIASISGVQLTTPPFSVYGHQTSKTSWLNTGPSNPISTVSYYDTGEPYQATDPLGHTTSTYFCTGSAPTTLPCTASTYMGALPTVVSNAKSQQSSFTYRTDTGQNLTATDPNLQTTTYAYSDPLNRVTSISYPDGGSSGIQYNDTGSIGVTVTQKITSSLNKQTQAIVDGLGRLSQTILLSDPSGKTYTQTTYDALGRKYQVWNPTRCLPTTSPCTGESTWGITTYNYDALGRETLLIPADGTSTTDNQPTSYSGNTVTVKDEAGNTRTTTSDALGRLTQVSEGTAAYITLYSYDALGNLLCAEQHGGVTGTGCSSAPSNDATSPWRVRRFTYDSLSRLLTAKNPETGTITYGYNLDGVLTSKTDNRGMTVTYTPETLHRISTIAHSDSTPTITNTYDGHAAGTNYGVGRRTSMSDGSGSTTFTFDTMGRIWSEAQTIGTVTKTTTNTYNYDGSVAQITYPSGSVIKITPGGDGRPLAAVDSTHSISYATMLAYAPSGELSTGYYGVSGTYSGILQSDSFNSRGQPIRLQACGLSACTDGSGSTTPYLFDLSYNYGLGMNDNGNVQGITNNKNTSRSQAFTYDGLNRLVTAKTASTWGISFTTSSGSPGIDAWGNLFQTNTISGTATNPMSVTQVVNVNNQFTANGYAYDAAGNVLQDGSGTTACSGYAYSWNAEEEMTCSLGATYVYDGDGIRVKKSGGGATPTLYWGSGTLAESDTSGNLTSEYIYLNGRRIARRDVATGNVYYFFQDMLGSSNVVANSSGVLQNESDFYPFGGEAAITQSLTNQHYRFTGKERDTESGNDYFGARYYASSMGRFTSPDWSATADTIPYAELDNPQSFNLYGYVVNNPLGWVDTDGHDVSDSEWMNLSSDTFNSQMQSLFQNSLHEETNNQEETSGYDSSDSGSVGYFIRPGIRKKKPRPPPGLPPELLASIYADMFEGRLTASGTVFRQSGYTAALLPRSNWHAVKMHTRVRLTHAGRSVVVDINDRGKGADSGGKLRVLDLTRAAASYLTGQPINSDSDANGVGLITVTAQPVSQDTPLGPVAPQE